MKDNFIKRIEGHGNLHINYRNHSAKIVVKEEERLFEQLVIGYPYQRTPFITARICGICPTAHYLASIKAIEAAFDINSLSTVDILREILLAGQIVQSHTLHLFFLVLPDYLKTRSVKEMTQRYPAEFHLGLNLKNLADKLIKVLGGREIHPLTPTVGGFNKKIEITELQGLEEEIDEVLDEAYDTVKLIDKIDLPEIHQDSRAYLSLESKNYPLLANSKITGIENERFNINDYQKYIRENERKGTLAKLSQYRNKKDSKLIMVGALARLNKANDKLMPQAKKLLNKSRLNLPSTNPFDNIMGQAIEINHYLEVIKEKLGLIKESDLDNLAQEVKVKKGTGVGAVEAPRGTLYHKYVIDKNGKIVKADIITPTASSLLSLENDADKLVKLNKESKQSELEKLTESLIRAYDPCLTCSVH